MSRTIPHQHFCQHATLLARRSKDPSTQVGCVIVDPNERRAVSEGYNGFPRGVRDTVERLNHRPTKLLMSIHAETNAILFARRSLLGAHCYVTMHPCSHCAGAIIQSGMSQVYCPEPTASQMDRWGESFRVAQEMLTETGVSLVFLPDSMWRV